MRRILTTTAPHAAALLLALGAHAAGPPRLPTAADRDAFMASHRLAHPPSPVPSPVTPPRVLATQQDVDVQSYDLSLFLDVAAQAIDGRCAVTFVTAAGSGSADELVLDLHDRLPVSAVERDGSPIDLATVTHALDVLRIPLVPPLAEGAGASTVTISYGGQPAVLSFGTLTFSSHDTPPQPMIFTLSEPFFGRGWWPCKDEPDDKATTTVHVEAPNGLVVASNGVQQSIVPGRAGNSITTWHESYPISTYLVAVSVTNYATWSDTYTALDGSTTMPITYWAWPEEEAAAREDWSITPDVMSFYAQSFFEYPFLNEKYGEVMVPLWGGMEHQTATSYGGQLVTGDHRYDFVVVHELAHQWWGDFVGPKTFDSIWLNEGFATYCEALWWEHLGGLTQYRNFLRQIDPWPRAEYAGTVHQPLDYFNNTVYDKGAWVLHMLRWVVGQPANPPDSEPLLRILRAHAAEHPYGNASTDDFAATASRIAGQDLTWFFDEWVHREGRPAYEVGWSAAPQAGGGWVVYLRVRQTQAGATYSMPVSVRITLPSGVQDVVVSNALAMEDYQFPEAELPTSVDWDPDSWVLKQLTLVDADMDDDGWPDWLDGCPTIPNPGQEDLNGNGVQDACEPAGDFDGDGVQNVSDCAPADAGAWSPPPDATLLRVRKDRSRGIVLSFQNPNMSPQRACSTDVAVGDLAVLRATRSTASGTCLVAAEPSPDFVDPSPFPLSGAAWYLAWPWNGCGPVGSLCR